MIQREIYEFGPYTLDPAQMLLRRAGDVVALQPRALETLLVLLRQRGEVVSKQELMERVWPDSFVEEGNLTQNIFLLRRELGKTPEGEEYIQTVPKRGYRMNVAVKESSRVGGMEGLSAGAAGIGITEAQAEATTGSANGMNWRVAAWPVLAMLLAIALGIGAIALWRVASTRPRVSGYVRITQDGALKRGIADHVGGPDAALFADESRVYFMEGSSDAPWIAEVSARGGETGRVAVSFPLPQLMDFSLERSELLVGRTVDEAGPLQLWGVPVPAGVAHRLGDASAWDASWSPDGRGMVYARGKDLYRAKSDGSEPRLLVTLPGLGWQPRWSPDGKRVRLTVFDVPTSASSIWEVSREGTDLRPLLSPWPAERPSAGPSDGPINVCCGSWTPDGKYFVFQVTMGGRSDIWSMPGKDGFLGRLFPSIAGPEQLTNGQLSSLAPVFSPDGRKMFVIGQQLRGELERFDARTGEFVTYLGGLSASFVDFSGDGQWITYVAYPEGTLWRSRLDGSERLELAFAPMEAMVPKWSPDGDRILFYGIGAGKEQRAYWISSSGGEAKPVSTGRGEEMNSCWSPGIRQAGRLAGLEFSLTPDGAPIVLRDVGTQEIYSLDWSER